MTAATTAFGASAAAAPTLNSAGVYYVSTSGSDTGNCAARNHPCATVDYALTQAPAGSTIRVAAGTYHQQISITKPIRLSGAGAGTTVIDGQGLDDPADVAGVLHIGATGGAVFVSGFTFTNPAAYALTSGAPVAVNVYYGGASDTVTFTNNTVSEGTADPNAGQDFPIGIDSFQSPGQLTVANNTIDGFFQGGLFEAAGPTAFNNNVVRNGISGDDGTTVYPAEGVYLLSDSGSDQSGQVVKGNKFTGYGGYGVALSAGYDNGNCTNNPCNGSLEAIVANNQFALSTSTPGTAAISAKSIYNGNVLTATFSKNTGYVTDPSVAERVRALSGGETEVNIVGDKISVNPNATARGTAHLVDAFHRPTYVH